MVNNCTNKTTKPYFQDGEKKITKLKIIANNAMLIMAFSMAAYERDEALFAKTNVRPVAKKVINKQANGMRTVQNAFMGCICSISVQASYDTRKSFGL